MGRKLGYCKNCTKYGYCCNRKGYVLLPLLRVCPLLLTKNSPSVAGVQSIYQQNMKLYTPYISFPVLLVTGSQSLFAIFAGLLRHQVLYCPLSTSLPHLISGLPLLFLPFGDEDSIRLIAIHFLHHYKCLTTR